MVSERFPWNCPCSPSAPVLLDLTKQWLKVPSGEEEYEPHQWTFATCVNCERPYLLYQEATYSDHGYGEMSDMEQIYPSVGRSLPFGVPEPLRTTHEEVQRCLEVRAYTGAALLTRRIVEGICEDLGATGRTLAAKLNKLKSDGVIDVRLHEWSSLVKDLGNSGAHETGSQISKEDAEDAFAFAEALIDYLYVFRMRFERFKRRTEGRSDLVVFDLKELTKDR